MLFVVFFVLRPKNLHKILCKTMKRRIFAPEMIIKIQTF